MAYTEGGYGSGRREVWPLQAACKKEIVLENALCTTKVNTVVRLEANTTLQTPFKAAKPLPAGLKPLHQENRASGCGVLRPGVARREMMFSFPADPDPLQEENHELIWLRKIMRIMRTIVSVGCCIQGLRIALWGTNPKTPDVRGRAKGGPPAQPDHVTSDLAFLSQ